MCLELHSVVYVVLSSVAYAAKLQNPWLEDLVGSISILFTNLSSKENKSRDSNPGPLGAKLEHYP